MAAILLVVAAASIYLVYVLEILKFRRVNAMRMKRVRPDDETDADARRQMETGEFDAIKAEPRSPAQRP
jgi:UDP-GlcNAc:undecaprenyl-phosphate GlcNAc-1-phosphate transferase